MIEPDIVQREGLRFGRLGEHWAHICVDTQRLFAEATEWQTSWMARMLLDVTVRWWS